MKKVIKKITYKMSRLLRESYYYMFPDTKVLAALEQRPLKLTLETTNICNANCIFCAYQYQKRPKQIMEEETFKKAIGDFVAFGGGTVCLNGVVGDPLIDTNIAARIRYCCSQRNIRKIELVTNGLNLHNIGVKELLTSGIDTINISTTGFNAEMYQRIYRSKRYETMKRNVLELLRTNHKLGKPVTISICLRIDKPMKEVQNLPDFEEVRKLADHVSSNWYFDNWAGKIKPEDLTGTMKLRPTWLNPFKKRSPCWLLYAGTAVLSNGAIDMCSCRDVDGDSELVLGNINQISLQDAFRSEYLRQLRNDWISGKKVPKICQDCSDYSSVTFLMLRESSWRFNQRKV